VASPGGPRRLPDGSEATGHLTPGEFARVLARSNMLLHPGGDPAWKIEVDSLDKSTIGFVAGVNKTLLGRDQDGRLSLVRSSDTGLGDHFLDPTGTGARLDDGRTVWTATLQERFLADLLARGNDAPLRVPPDLPDWADHPALRPGRASSLDDIGRLRCQVGDPTVAPFTRYVTASTGAEHPPVCLGVERDPATWQSWPWHQNGQPCRIGVQDRNGTLVVSYGSGPLFVVPTIRDAFRDWLSENDPTLGGPKRGLRHVLPVRSHPALIDPVGRSGELAGERAEDEPLVFSAVEPSPLAVPVSAAELARLSGVPPRTVQDIVFGRAVPSEPTLRRLLPAVVDLKAPARCAAGAECRHGVDGLGALLARGQRSWCSEPCRKVVYRRGRGIPPRRSKAGAPAASSNGSISSVAKGLSGRGFAREPSCPGCGSIFVGRVPESCPDCATPLSERTKR